MASSGVQRSSLARLRAVAALESPNLAVARKARIGLGFEVERGNARTLVEIETLAGGVGQLALPYSLRWLVDVLSGLTVLHEARLEPDGTGFVHGEVTPERIYLSEDGVGKLAPLVPGHWTPNTYSSPDWIGYLAPEALLGDSMDLRADLFSVGVMLWESLAAQRLFDESSSDAIVMRLMSGKVELPPLSGDDAWASPLAAVAKRAISVNPRQRFASAREFRMALERAAADHLASTSGMADLFRDPAAGSRRIGGAVTVPRPGPADMGPPSSAKTAVAPSAPPLVTAPAAVDSDVDDLLSVPVAGSTKGAVSEPVLTRVRSPEQNRNDRAGFFEVPEPPRERHGLLWFALLLVLLLCAGGALAYPPVREHPLVAKLLRRLPLPEGFAPAAAPNVVPSAPGASEGQDARLNPSEPPPPASEQTAKPEPVPLTSSLAASSEPEPPVLRGARRAGSAKVAPLAGSSAPLQAAESAAATPVFTPPEPSAAPKPPAPEPPASASAPRPAAPKKPTTAENKDSYGI